MLMLASSQNGERHTGPEVSPSPSGVATIQHVFRGLGSRTCEGVSARASSYEGSCVQSEGL